MGKSILIFSGFNQRAVVAFIRTLQSTGTPFAVIASRQEDPIFSTEYKDKVVATRAKKELDLSDILTCVNQAKEQLDTDELVIAPSTEALNRFLINNRHDFEQAGCRIPLVNKELYERISDKHSFGELCKDSGITVPSEFESLDGAAIPCVAKPHSYFSPDGRTHSPVLIRTQAELDDFKGEYNAEDFYYQKYVDGDSIYLLYYFYEDGSVAKLSQQNFVQQPGGKSMVAASISNFHNGAESNKYEELFRSVNFSGLVMVEVKSQGENFFMIEANPRFWGPSQLFVDAGVNLFEAFLFDNGLIDQEPEFGEPELVNYFWFGGVLDALKSGSKLAYHTLGSKEFAQNLATWMQADVYNRDDTRELFIKETGLDNDDQR